MARAHETLLLPVPGYDNTALMRAYRRIHYDSFRRRRSLCSGFIHAVEIVEPLDQQLIVGAQMADMPSLFIERQGNNLFCRNRHVFYE